MKHFYHSIIAVCHLFCCSVCSMCRYCIVSACTCVVLQVMHLVCTIATTVCCLFKSCIVFMLATASTFCFVNKLVLFFVVLCFLSILSCLLCVYCVLCLLYCTVLCCIIYHQCSALCKSCIVYCYIVCCVSCVFVLYCMVLYCILLVRGVL